MEKIFISAMYQALKSASCFFDTVWADSNIAGHMLLFLSKKKVPLRSMLKLDDKVQR